MTLIFDQTNNPIFHFPAPNSMGIVDSFVKMDRLLMDLWHFYADIFRLFATVKVFDLTISQ